MKSVQASESVTNQPVHFEAKWDNPQLTDSDLSQNSNTAFEWWYFDVETPDGLELVIFYVFRSPIFSKGKLAVYLELKSGKKSVNRIRNYDAEHFQKHIDGRNMELQFGPGQVLAMRNDGDETDLTWTLQFDVEGVVGELQVKPRNRGFLPTPDGRYMLDSNGRHSCVSFSSPATRVTGTLTIDGKSRSVDGPGYHDHPWGTAQLMTTNQRWHWARARQNDVAVMFALVEPQPDFTGGLDFLYEGKPETFEPTIVHNVKVTTADWRKDHFYGIRFPHALTVNCSAGEWWVQARFSLLDTPIYNRAEIAWQSAESSDPPGKGWVEFYHVSPRIRKLVRIVAKLGAFFMRRPPFFGQ